MPQSKRAPSKTPTKKHTHASKPSTAAPRRNPANAPAHLTPLQSTLLGIFAQAFSDDLAAGPAVLHERIQRLKSALYARDFAAAFAEALPEDLVAYALRWSPARALAYCFLFCSEEIGGLLWCVIENRGSKQRRRRTSLRCSLAAGVDESTASLKTLSVSVNDECLDPPPKGNGIGSAAALENEVVRIVALGGGAGAELVAFAGMLAHHRSVSETPIDKAESPTSITESRAKAHIHILDMAPWQAVLHSLNQAIAARSQPHTVDTTESSGSPSSLGLPTNALSMSFTQTDILALTPAQLSSELHGARIVTILFTLNELYATSKGKTTALLLHLTELLESGCRLLVVDSAGSYAGVDVGGRDCSQTSSGQTSKRYPMHFLLDHTLLADVTVHSPAKSTGSGATRHSMGKKVQRWRKVHVDEARWLRLPADIAYPLPLEDMRMQIHCYERT